MQCGGNTTSPAAKRLPALVDNLAKCEDNIKDKCIDLLPKYDKAVIDQCSDNMKAFSSEVDKCVSGGGCTCWKADTLVTAQAKLADCDFSKTNAEFAGFKKNCIEAFGACRQLQDEAGQAVTICSTNSAAVKVKIDAVTKNKESLTALNATVTTVTTMATQNRRLRALFRDISCVSFEVVINMAKDAPTSDKVSSSVNDLMRDSKLICSESEKTRLLTLLEEVLVLFGTVLANLNNDYAGMKLYYYDNYFLVSKY